MKKIFLFASLIFISFASMAMPKSPVTVDNFNELCALEEEETSQSFEEIAFENIKETESMSEFVLKLVNFHLTEEQYSEKELSFTEIKALFSNQGDQGYNDLYITTFRSAISGNVYIEVKSYPGDNPYAHIFNARNGNIIAYSADGSMTLLTKNGAAYCSDIQ